MHKFLRIEIDSADKLQIPIHVHAFKHGKHYQIYFHKLITGIVMQMKSMIRAKSKCSHELPERQHRWYISGFGWFGNTTLLSMLRSGIGGNMSVHITLGMLYTHSFNQCMNHSRSVYCVLFIHKPNDISTKKYADLILNVYTYNRMYLYINRVREIQKEKDICFMISSY